MDRILEIGASATALNVEHDQLVVRLADADPVTTPLAEIAALVISNPRVMMSQAVVAGVAASGGSVVICDRAQLPTAMMLPLQTHVTQTERFAAQAAMPLPLRKRLWAQVVAAKIRAQSRLLTELHGDDAGLEQMAGRVRSGDAGNLEAQAAKRYWPRLFADPKFRRGREGPDQNSHLNYGYAVLRALTARAICGVGLHPSLGLHHRNRYDAFCLASDLMEPFRPVVDRAVFAWVQDHDPAEPLDKGVKGFLIQPMLRAYEWKGETRSLFDWLAKTASSLVAAMGGRAAKLDVIEV